MDVILLSTIERLVSRKPSIVIATDSNQIITLTQMNSIILSRGSEALVRHSPIKYQPSMNLSSSLALAWKF
jgi:hypothetical protein